MATTDRTGERYLGVIQGDLRTGRKIKWLVGVRRRVRTQVSVCEILAMKGGCGSGVGIVSYGALRCESVTES